LGPGKEFDLIRRLLADGGPAPKEVLVGPGDDCAVLEGGLVVSVDLSVEDVHFRREWITLEEAGFRAAAGALSDLAAMAADPIGVLLSLALSTDEAEAAAVALQRGAGEACRLVGAALLGGDLSRSPGGLVMDVTVLGRADSPLLRSGCRPGDEVWVTGTLGDSAAAVQAWRGGRDPGAACRAAFARPTPRIREARWLQEHTVLHGGIDLSDGLAGDAGHLASASEVALILRADALPFSRDLEEWAGGRAEALHLALQGGEDYELCVTVPPGALDDLVDPFRRAFDLPLSRVGRVESGSGVRVDGGPVELGKPGGGFSHFQKRETE
jgi:thiamine-monophosphate kinase